MTSKRSEERKKVWIEISKKAAQHNASAIKRLLKPKTKLYAVVKSNAYGHGLALFSTLINPLGVDGFGVDSVVEGLTLRRNGIKKPILVLGPTLPGHSLSDAFHNKITLTLSNWEALSRYAKSRAKPDFHLKIDTGMHRQGFYASEVPKAIAFIRNQKAEVRNSLKGAYTHFASSKDLNYPTFTDFQFHEFKKAVKQLESKGFTNLIKHAAATGAAFINPEYHLDAVRIGIGLYGLWPSRELELQMRRGLGRAGMKQSVPQLELKPVLSWRALVSEIKMVPKGGYIGYDLVHRAYRPTKMAIIPIGYWHGFDRRLSDTGEVLIAGKRARVLGRVSMDMLAVDVTGIPCAPGSAAVIIGRQSGGEITAQELAQKIGSIHYEIVTRTNPLIARVLV